MGEIIDLTSERDSRDPQTQIRLSLEREGTCQALQDDLSMSVPEWRSMARAAARELKRPIETAAGSGMVWAVLRDWPLDAAEEAVRDASMRKAMEALGEALFPDGLPIASSRTNLRIVDEK